MYDIQSDFGFCEKTCSECRKLFEIRFIADYAYTTSYRGARQYYCSWHCYRAASKRHDANVGRGCSNPVTPDEKRRIIDLFRSGSSIRGIVQDVGRSFPTVAAILEREGLYKSKKVNKIDDAEARRMAEEYQRTKSLNRLAKLTKHDKQTIKEALIRMGVQVQKQGFYERKERAHDGSGA